MGPKTCSSSIHPPSLPALPSRIHWNGYPPRVLRASFSDEPCYRDRLLWTASWKTISFVPCLPAGLHFKYSSQDGPLFSLLLDPGPQPPPVAIPGVAVPFSLLRSYCPFTIGSPGCGLFLLTQHMSSCCLLGRGGGQYGISPLDCQCPSWAHSRPGQVYV